LGRVDDLGLLVSDRDTGRSRGFAFVTMGSRAEGQAAIDGLQGRELDGRPLSVNEARPREERSGAGGSRPGRPSGGKKRRW
jgi:RNA recognition motif-containing protein